MSSYHCNIKSGKKGKADDHARYIERAGKHGMKTDLVLTAHGNLPTWAEGNPSAFWRSADKFERANGAAYREFVLALPSEFNTDQQRKLVEEFINAEIGDKPYHLAIHCPKAALGCQAQPHAHVMFSDRKPDGIDRSPEQYFKRFNPTKPESGGCKKDSGGKDRIAMREGLISTRANWAKIQNEFLAHYGHEGRVDHRSNKDRGIDRDPERHLGFLGIKKLSNDDKEILKNKRQSEKPA